MQVRTGIVVSVAAAALVVALVAASEGFDAHRAGPTAAAPVTAQVGGAGGEWHDYLAPAFTQDLASHKTVLVAVHASWCTDCAAQAPIMARLLQEPKFDEVAAYVVNFDRERKFLSAHKVRQQSTLLVFKDGVEVARSVADTSEARIRALFEQGL